MSTTIKNDEKILELKEQIAIKKKKLERSVKFTPITNCSIELDSARYNIQTLSKDQLIMLAVKLNTYKRSANELELDLIISSYSINDWLYDVLCKLKIMNHKQEEAQLKAMENKLDMLLSNDKKTELEVKEIETLLSK